MAMELCEKFGKQGLTFDDVLLIPAESDVTPNMIDYDSSHGYSHRGKNGNCHCKRRRYRYHPQEHEH